MSKNPKVVGVYRLIMKAGSDNFRESAIFSLINFLIEKGIKIIIFEPEISFDDDSPLEFDDNIDNFIASSDLIIANRIDSKLEKYRYKVYTRDIFNRD
jgi:UDPglucose 6-dehydrogenase